MTQKILMLKFSPSPSNINYMWNNGSLLLMILIIQLISGLFISLHFNSSMENAFSSIIHINREVNSGFMIRFIHINGASSFFFFLFMHLVKNMMNSSWKFKLVWISGIFIILLSMMVAFIGYVLPWGQMSFWAATVITNLLSAVPYFGSMLVMWIWGGFSVSYPTISRFFSFHFIFPFIILMMVFIHILFLHLNGSSNTISSPLNMDKISFDPFFSVKDLLGYFVFFFFFFIIMLSNPYYSVDSENFIEANPMITPIHIKPEWYFLFAYAILRSIPNKIGGVFFLMMSILIFIIKPFQKINMKSKFNFFKKVFLMMFFFNFIILTFLGEKMIEIPFEFMSKIMSITYFILVLFI